MTTDTCKRCCPRCQQTGTYPVTSEPVICWPCSDQHDTVPTVMELVIEPTEERMNDVRVIGGIAPVLDTLTSKHVEAAKAICDRNPMGNARWEAIAQLLADQTAADRQRIVELEAEVARERHEKEMVVKAGAGVSAMKAALEECLERNAAIKKDCERFVWNLEACRDLGDLRGGAMFDARIFDKEWVHPAFESVNRMYQDLRKAQGLRVKEDAKR